MDARQLDGRRTEDGMKGYSPFVLSVIRVSSRILLMKLEICPQ